MELVRRVTGNKAVDVVLKHYFRPGREVFKKTILASMPVLMLAGAAVASDWRADVKRLADKLTGRNWQKVQAELLSLSGS
jgi:hypothetical protein